MNKMIISTLCALLLSACQNTALETPTPTANKTIIEEAQKALAEYDEITVDDTGVISLVQTLPNRHAWKTSVIKKIGREVSCDNLRYFVNNGMVVSIHFQGPRGRYDQYDEQRCIDEDQYL
ncbi:hypothetical protein [Vibrio atypicus]|uniref:hypothetical protein n=1 Tax=Vibrio atypicus TaxID=558271 RepID=UPI00373596FA